MLPGVRCNFCILKGLFSITGPAPSQQPGTTLQEAEYEAALEQRRREVEAEQTMLEIQQAQLMAGLLDPVPHDSVPSLPESTTDAGREAPSSLDMSRTPSETQGRPYSAHKAGSAQQVIELVPHPSQFRQCQHWQ